MKRFKKELSFCCFNVHFYLLLGLLAISCNKDQFGFPLVYTGEAVEISENGVVFHGKVLEEGISQIINHGFVWGTSQHLDLASDYRVQLGSINDTHFKKEISAGLEEGITYYLRAYIEKPNQIIYGRMVSFVSLGSKPPSIKSINPENGVWGETLTIYSENLGFTLQDVKAYVGEHNVQIIEFFQDSLRIAIPPTLLDTVAPISLVLFNNQVYSEKPFSIDPPEIFSFSPEGGIKDSTVVISGRAFHPVATRNSASLGNASLQIISNSPNQLVVKLPEILVHGGYPISVSTLGRTTTSHNSFTFYQPWRRLKDRPFQSTVNRTSFEFGNRAFVVAYGSSTNILRVWEYHANNDSWSNLSSVPTSNDISNSVSTSTNGYQFNNKSLHQYNPTNNLWSSKASIPIAQSVFDSYSAFCIGNHIYVAGGGTGNSYHNYVYTNKVYKYNEDTNNWVAKQSLPEHTIYDAIGFSIGMNGYIAFGLKGEGQPNLNIYQYHSPTDTWSIINSFEGILFNGFNGRRHIHRFIIDNQAFFFGGHRAINPGSIIFRDCYRFDPSTNQIIRLPELPQTWNPWPMGSSFVLNGKGYFADGYNAFWEFDPEKLPPWLK